MKDVLIDIPRDSVFHATTTVTGGFIQPYTKSVNRPQEVSLGLCDAKSVYA
jgi:hypothetical protein